MSTYKVRWMKYFVNGSLQGLTYDSELDFPTLDAATAYTRHLLAHTETPVEAIGGSDYTCHTIRIDTE